MPLNAFVTGAAGFIGSHVAETLLSRGDRVFGLDNFDPFYDRALKEKNLALLRERKGFSFLEGISVTPRRSRAGGPESDRTSSSISRRKPVSAPPSPTRLDTPT